MWISIHALLAESDREKIYSTAPRCVFLSTLSLRRATSPLPSSRRNDRNFYPRSPCGERPLRWIARSVHGTFLSTLSLRRATYRINARYTKRAISIHALLAESDISCAWSASKLGDFYPRSPCGERPKASLMLIYGSCISIHALLAESDADGLFFFNRRRNFYPRSPCGERRGAVFLILCPTMISIHALLAESDTSL